MDNFIKITLLILSGSMAILLAGNFLVHLLFYLIDGNVGKFLSPIWVVMNGVMVFLCLVFVFVLRGEKVVSG